MSVQIKASMFLCVCVCKRDFLFCLALTLSRLNKSVEICAERREEPATNLYVRKTWFDEKLLSSIAISERTNESVSESEKC